VDPTYGLAVSIEASWQARLLPSTTEVSQQMSTERSGLMAVPLLPLPEDEHQEHPRRGEHQEVEDEHLHQPHRHVSDLSDFPGREMPTSERVMRHGPLKKSGRSQRRLTVLGVVAVAVRRRVTLSPSPTSASGGRSQRQTEDAQRLPMPMSVLQLVGISVLEGRLADHAVVDEKVATR
jgi:hypothetical protein